MVVQLDKLRLLMLVLFDQWIPRSYIYTRSSQSLLTYWN